MRPINEQLRHVRLSKNLSQKELGIKLGIPQSHVSAIESGKVDPRLSSVVEMSRVLGLEPMLIPLRLIPMVQGLITGKTQKRLWSIDEDEDEDLDNEENEEEIK